MDRKRTILEGTAYIVDTNPKGYYADHRQGLADIETLRDAGLWVGGVLIWFLFAAILSVLVVAVCGSVKLPVVPSIHEAPLRHIWLNLGTVGERVPISNSSIDVEHFGIRTDDFRFFAMNVGEIKIISMYKQIFQRKNKSTEVLVFGREDWINRLLSFANATTAKLSRSIPFVSYLQAIQVRHFFAFWVNRFGKHHEPRSFRSNQGFGIQQSGFGGFGGLFGLFGNGHQSQENNPYCCAVGPSEEGYEYVPTWAVPVGILDVLLGMILVRFSGDSACIKVCGFLCGICGCTLILTGYDCRETNYNKENRQVFPHNSVIVPQKHLTDNNYWDTVIHMANVLNTDKQIAVIGALTEGSSIRSIERITGVHRDTIMRLGVKVGQGCTALMDAKMRNLSCRRLEMDEIWGFVGKKERSVREGDSGVGSVWTFCAIDADTKLVPAFKVGDRSIATANAFVQDVAGRMAYRVQISTDGLGAYVAAMENAFGGNVDYAQIIKTYGHEEANNNRRYSAPQFVSSEKRIVVGNPDERLISTSYIERLNATTRLHMRRLTRLTLAFSKKRENFEAAVGLHFAYYNFVKRHNTLRCTPAMAAGVTGSMWSVGELIEAVA